MRKLALAAGAALILLGSVGSADAQWGRGWGYGGYYGYRHGGWGGGGAFAAGLIGGAILGAAATAPAYGYGYPAYGYGYAPRPVYRAPAYGFYDREDAKDYVKGYRRAQKEIFKDRVRVWNRTHGY